MLDKDFLNLLVCPACKAPLLQDGDNLICQRENCGLRYPVEDGVPVLLVDRATKPDDKPKEA